MNNKQILIEIKDKLKRLIREVLLEENWTNWSLIIADVQLEAKDGPYL
jgi:hypothetical protein